MYTKIPIILIFSLWEETVFRNFEIFPFLEKAIFSLFSSRKDAHLFVFVTQKRYGNVTVSDYGNSENTQNTVFSFIFTYLHHTKRCDFVQWQPLFFPWLPEKLFIEKKVFFCRLCKNVWITCCTHMTSHATWVDEITRVMISIKKIIENLGAVHMRWDGPATRAGSARWGDFYPAFIWNFLSHFKKLVASL